MNTRVDASTAPREFTKENVSKRRNTMSEESKKIEKIEQEAKQDVKEVKPTELSEQELNDVAGGYTAHGSRSNVKNNIA
jgi:hypothetical protein